MRESKWPSVCFLAGTLGQGGAERQLFYILKTLQECGTRLRLLCLTQGEFWQGPIEQLGIPITWVGRSGNRAARLACILRALRAQRFDIVQSQHFYTNLYAVAAARTLGLSEIGAIRNDLDNEVRALGGLLGKMSLRMPRVIAANSQTGIKNAIKHGASPDRIHHLPNVIDVIQFKPGQRPQAARVTILAIGRCVPQKRLDRFLAILDQLRKRTQIAVRGVVLGDGPLRTSLEDRAREMGLSPDIVEFMGNVPDVTRFYRDANIFLLTSDWEGTPNVLLEAMASGLPVVAARVGGATEVVAHGTTGYLFDPGDDETAVAALTELVADVQLREAVGRRARQYVESNHSLQRLAPALERLYDSVL